MINIPESFFIDLQCLLHFWESLDSEIKHFWCDGIAAMKAQRIENEDLVIYTHAFLGNTGQDRFKCWIWLGPKVTEKILRKIELDLQTPESPFDEWCVINLPSKTLEIYLD